MQLCRSYRKYRRPDVRFLEHAPQTRPSGRYERLWEHARTSFCHEVQHQATCVGAAPGHNLETDACGDGNHRSCTRQRRFKPIAFCSCLARFSPDMPGDLLPPSAGAEAGNPQAASPHCWCAFARSRIYSVPGNFLVPRQTLRWRSTSTTPSSLPTSFRAC